MVVITILDVQPVKILAFFERDLEVIAFLDLHVIEVPA